MSPLALIASLSVVVVVALGWLLNRLVATRKVFDVDLAWWGAFRPERYSPVLRLLSQKDFDRLREMWIQEIQAAKAVIKDSREEKLCCLALDFFEV